MAATPPTTSEMANPLRWNEFVRSRSSQKAWTPAARNSFVEA